MFRYVTAVMTVFFALAVNAGAITITTTPSGLAPGSAYQLLFVTSTTRTGDSSDISDYNAHVMAAAAPINDLLGLDALVWNAVASTSTVHAFDNAQSINPVYNLNDEQVAGGSGGGYSVSLMNAVGGQNRATRTMRPVIMSGQAPTRPGMF